MSALEDEKPPVFGSWKAWHSFVLFMLVVYILTLVIFSQVYA